MVEQADGIFKRRKGSSALSMKKKRPKPLFQQVEAVYAASFCFLARVLDLGSSAFSGFSTAS